MESKYTIIDKKSLADALNFLGFRYYVFDREDRKIYSFESTEEFKFALHGILQLRDQIKSINSK